jgi:AmmeMemoRadiSam system protein A
MSSAFPSNAGPTLTSLAHRAIAQRLEVGSGSALLPSDDWLQVAAASFVTLTLGGRLRGCIGSLEAYRPLATDVVQNAQAAAFRDPRFPPLTAVEFKRLAIEVSVLSVPEPLVVTTETDLLTRLRPDHDGVIFAVPGRRATFLPQVWQELPDPVDFIAQLKRKAGLAADYWSDDVRLWRYHVTAFAEARPGKPDEE